VLEEGISNVGGRDFQCIGRGNAYQPQREALEETSISSQETFLWREYRRVTYNNITGNYLYRYRGEFSGIER